MIPGELKDISAWVNWKLSRTNRSKPTWTKPPIQPSGALAKVNDPKTWHSYLEVWDAYEGGGFDGIGFVLTQDDPYAILDLDHCRDAVTGVIEPWAMDIFHEVDSYTEISVTGTGLHIVAKATLPTAGRKKGDFEVYELGRYLTFTGHQFDGTTKSIEMRQEAIAFVTGFATFKKTRQLVTGQAIVGTRHRGNLQFLNSSFINDGVNDAPGAQLR